MKQKKDSFWGVASCQSWFACGHKLFTKTWLDFHSLIREDNSTFSWILGINLELLKLHIIRGTSEFVGRLLST